VSKTRGIVFQGKVNSNTTTSKISIYISSCHNFTESDTLSSFNDTVVVLLFPRLRVQDPEEE
jgi:hypothetical protein